jgi:hypothetical protein
MAKLSWDLPPGFKFSPTDVQIIDYYLRSKITGNDKNLYITNGNDEKLYFIPEIQFSKLEPGDMAGDQFSTPFCLL